MGHGRTVSRFRHHRGRAVAGVIVTISVVTLAAASPWLIALAVPPLAWTVWAWRAGTDADRDGLRVRALLGQRRVDWSDVTGLGPGRDGRPAAALTGGRELPLPAVTARDLPRLVAAGGDPFPPATADRWQ